jgi:hypothetical protein
MIPKLFIREAMSVLMTDRCVKCRERLGGLLRY